MNIDPSASLRLLGNKMYAIERAGGENAAERIRCALGRARRARFHGEMAAAKVKVTVSVGARTVPIEEVGDPRVRTALQGAARQVAEKLASVQCATHKRGPTDIRIHFDRSGAADLKYDSCCAAHGEKIGQVLG
jgi:hypothetical protein